MKRTDTSNPDYFHKVVDCQWGCPAHTDVPEYIRLIAQGRFDDAYMVNRESNVFPGILGRVCDRPCEPACRRGRMDEKPVAICRLKRVAADHRGDITDRLPVAPDRKNGKKIALIGAGPRFADGLQRPDAAGLRVHHFRGAGRGRRPDALQHPVFPPAAEGARRRNRLHPRHGRRHSLQPSRRKHEGSAGAGLSMPSSSAAARLAARSSSCPAATIPRTSISASTGWSRSPSGTSMPLAKTCW